MLCCGPRSERKRETERERERQRAHRDDWHIERLCKEPPERERLHYVVSLQMPVLVRVRVHLHVHVRVRVRVHLHVHVLRVHVRVACVSLCFTSFQESV